MSQWVIEHDAMKSIQTPNRCKMGEMVTSLLIFLCGNAFPIVASERIPVEISNSLIGTVKYSLRFQDTLGTHFLVLTRDHKVRDEKETISLRATQFLHKQNSWQQEWTIKDFIDCEHLDISGHFHTELIAISDLDSNRISETTVSYSLSCAGGVEPKVVKTIMRQGNERYAVRGESLVRIDEKTIFGGTFKADPILDSKPRFKGHLLSIWKRAAGVSK